MGIIADNPREATEQFAGKWVIEIGELAGYTSHTRERIKAFITKRFERARGVWKHFAENYPRAFIFIATVNPGGFLNDPTGERRWWIVEVKFYNRDAFLRDRDQLLAEALLAEPNEKLYLDTDELREAQASMAYDYKEPNELADVLAELKGYPFKRTEDGKLEERISNAAVRRFLDVEAKDLVRSGVRNLSASIANAMAHLGWRKATRTLTMEPGRAPERGYCRPVDTAKMPARDDAVPLGLGPRQPDIPGLAPPDAVQDYGADAAEVPVD